MAFTTLPDHTNWTKRALHSLSQRSTLSANPERRELLYEVSCAIQVEEESSRTLLQAFDIYEDYEQEEEGLLTPSASGPMSDVLNVPGEINSTPQNAVISSLPLPSTHPEHPFLSTPLRSKYFSRLSPSILRQLLRTPSPNVYTPDSSFEVPSSPTLNSFSTVPSLDFSDAQAQESLCTESQVTQTAGSTMDYYPLTPPLTARIPSTDAYETPVRMLHSPLHLSMASTPSLRVEGSGIDSVPDIRACLSSLTPSTTHDSRQSKRQRLVSFDADSSFDTPVSPATQLLPPIVSNSENRARAENFDVRKASFVSTLPSQESSTHGLEEVSLPVKARVLPSTPASPLIQNSQVMGNAKEQKSGRILQREFVELLESRAMEEEEEARELDALAKRLLKLASQRRRLVALMDRQSKH
ncbi:hypothetical protein C8R42DRAFT_720339 [Lentinula raphanica]|nr:hypothetical protein C8R42DRAFT_720339 [Lentinula raphanica]